MQATEAVWRPVQDHKIFQFLLDLTGIGRHTSGLKRVTSGRLGKMKPFTRKSWRRRRSRFCSQIESRGGGIMTRTGLWSVGLAGFAFVGWCGAAIYDVQLNQA